MIGAKLNFGTNQSSQGESLGLLLEIFGLTFPLKLPKCKDVITMPINNKNICKRKSVWESCQRTDKQSHKIKKRMIPHQIISSYGSSVSEAKTTSGLSGCEKLFYFLKVD